MLYSIIFHLQGSSPFTGKNAFTLKIAVKHRYDSRIIIQITNNHRHCFLPMKQIQDWMGHSDFSTTANIYAHLDYQSKVTSAEAMLAGLGLKAAGIEPLSE